VEIRFSPHVQAAMEAERPAKLWLAWFRGAGVGEFLGGFGGGVVLFSLPRRVDIGSVLRFPGRVRLFACPAGA
jgi:hypothetical protein